MICSDNPLNPTIRQEFTGISVNQLSVDGNPTWDSTIQAIIERPGVTMVIGGVDTGKTTFVRLLLNAGVAAGIPTAIVDADTGQSEVGPPAAISMATVDRPVESLKELRARRMYFVGSTTPVGHLLPTVIGVKRMVDDALDRGAKLVVVDTSGLIKGLMGSRLKLYKADLLAPDHIVGIEKKRDLDAILAVLARIDRYTLHRVPMSPEARSKPQVFRQARRKTQFYEYFRTSERHIIRMDEITCWGTLFTTGRPVRWQHFRTIEKLLKTKVLHAEVTGNGMYIVANCKPGMAGIEALVDKYGTREFTIVCGSDFSNVLTGLADSKGNTLDLGIIEAIDFGQRHISVVTPLKTVTPVKLLHFGSMRVRQDGTELGRIKPGEI